MSTSFSRACGSRSSVAGLLVAAAVAVCGGNLRGQDEKKDDETTDKAAESQADAAKADGGEKFQDLYEDWKMALTKLRKLKADAVAADEEKRQELQQQWDAAIAETETLLVKMRTIGAEEFTAAPNQDRRVSRFLAKLLTDDVRGDRYQPALQLGQLLLDKKCEIKTVFTDAAEAAYSVDKYDQAEKLFKMADSNGSLSPENRLYLESIPEYKTFWKRELELRKAETEADDLPRVKLQTNRGDLVIELFENEAPETVGNFMYLVKSQFYDGLVFHRVLPNFMAQGGCPVGDGTSGPGYKIYCECNQENARMHFRGTLSMAHAGQDTAGSQFFITFRPTPHLNKRHTAFGRVIEGLDVLEKIQRRDLTAPKPPKADRILKAEVIRERDHEYAPNKVQ
ncbi:MAG: peptidylprolyl isomerase [Pirellulaceae bacterium]|nr:peptidylprolyl isomerase [Pirellulaceae bacterium]MDP7016718.1 peptidylprolyl isomerase [Pirellulaceae bacterium]